MTRWLLFALNVASVWGLRKTVGTKQDKDDQNSIKTCLCGSVTQYNSSKRVDDAPHRFPGDPVWSNRCDDAIAWIGKFTSGTCSWGKPHTCRKGKMWLGSQEFCCEDFSPDCGGFSIRNDFGKNN